MKGFFQSVFGSLTAFILLIALGIFGFAAFIGVIATIGEQPLIEVQPDSVLILDLNTAIQDTPPSADIALALQEALSGSGQPTTYLLKVTDAIQRAKNDADISAILIHGSLIQSGYSSGLAAVSEIRQALKIFQQSGKPVYAYLVNPTQKDYYLASVADEIWLNPFGMLTLNGLATNSPFLGETLEKYGIGVQTTRVGEYKSAVEIFTRTRMSDADRQQKTALLNDLWQILLSEISHSRQIEPAQTAQLAHESGFFTATTAQQVQLIDQIGYLDQVIDHLADTYQLTFDGETFEQIDLINYANARGFERNSQAKSGERIALVYAEGEIIDGPYFPGYVAGDSLAAELRRLRKDPDVKAVVLRVNSPGGSALASEVIQRETRLLAQNKPLIVSMGSYAASGGYWIAAYADKIYAQPYTITGSIGVFGLIFNIQDAAENFALHFDGVKTARYADLYTISRPKTDEEMTLIQTFTDEIYDAFIDKVAEGRSINTLRVRELAQGRVWSGFSAKKLGLTDEIGGLNAALAHAITACGLTNPAIEQVPSPQTLSESITNLLEEFTAPAITRANTPLHNLQNEVQQLTQQLQGLNDPRHNYTRLPYGLEGL